MAKPFLNETPGDEEVGGAPRQVPKVAGLGKTNSNTKSSAKVMVSRDREKNLGYRGKEIGYLEDLNSLKEWTHMLRDTVDISLEIGHATGRW